MFDADLFCANLSRLRRSADMTQSELADKLNLTRQAVSRYEKGDSFPDISILVRIAEIFDITIDELIGAGAPTESESEILKTAALSGDIGKSSTQREILSHTDALEEIVMLGLRMNKGMDLTLFDDETLRKITPKLESLINWGLCERNGSYFCATSRGRDVLDSIIVDIISVF